MGQIIDYDKHIPGFFVCPNGHVVETVCLDIGYELECPDCGVMGRIFEEPVWKEVNPEVGQRVLGTIGKIT